MNYRRVFLPLIFLWLGCCVPDGTAQQDRVFHIAILNHKIPKVYEDVFLDPLRKLGYMEGQNLTVERAFGSSKELPALAAGVVRANVDLIIAGGSTGVRAAMGATRKIPVVGIDLESDPVASGFASSLAVPAGNLTGFFLNLPAFSAKRLEILKEALPGVTRVAVLYDPTLDKGPVNGVKDAARDLNLTLLFFEATDERTLEAAFKAAAKNKAGAVINMHSPGLDAYKARIIELATSHRLPLMALFASFTADGALLSYGPNIEDLTSRMSVYADKILRGARPGSLPIERPAKFDFVVNLKTAKALGIKIPSSVLARADEIIQ